MTVSDAAAATACTRTLERLRAGELHGSTRLDLRGCGLTGLPAEVLGLADTLEVLDLSGNALATLPDGMARLTRLHTLFASQNRFTALPEVLGRLPVLGTLGFKANRIETVPAAALAPTLRWLILTDNRVADLPETLGACARMQKLMLAGNRLRRLPHGIGRLQRLELLRLSANRFERVGDALPDELLALPRLAWLAHAGNPYSGADERAAAGQATAPSADIGRAAHRAIAWTELRLEGLLGEGASGQIHAASWRPADGPAGAEGATVPVAVKLFKGKVTSDGLPASEIAATLAACAHPHLVGVCGMLTGHPQGTPGLVLPRLGPQWAPLARPPSMASCSRDVYPDGWTLPPDQAAHVLRAAGDALQHLHARSLTHGDFYAHNLLVDGQGGALLSDFGAASFLPAGNRTLAGALQALDRRALAILEAELAVRVAG